MNHAVSLPCNHITEPATFVRATIYIGTNICIYTGRGMCASGLINCILREKDFFHHSSLVFSKSWFQDVEGEALEGREVPGVGGEINDSFKKHFLMPTLGRALERGGQGVEGIHINAISFTFMLFRRKGGGWVRI